MEEIYKSKFPIGSVWKTREGITAVIVEHDHTSHYPILAWLHAEPRDCSRSRTKPYTGCGMTSIDKHTTLPTDLCVKVDGDTNPLAVLLEAFDRIREIAGNAPKNTEVLLSLRKAQQ